ncbi:hypothetical protein DSECCO2_642680 [anaerobic digester metagenome]
MPATLDKVALKTAAETLPPARDTITTADETVEGSTARKKILNHKSEYIPDGMKNFIANINTGKKTKVVNCMVACNRQCTIPFQSVDRLRLIPYNKKMAEIPTSAKVLREKIPVFNPGPGMNLPKTIISNNNATNQSNFKRIFSQFISANLFLFSMISNAGDRYA